MNDLWGWRWADRYKAIAINNNGVKRTAWEQLLWGDIKGATHDVPQEIVVPADLLFGNMNCREYVASLLGHGWSSVSRMRDIVNAKQDQFKKLDKSFWMELDFFNLHFDDMLKQHLHVCLLAALPEQT